jgi:type II secretory ATPase GspE/PulE/Tfp pilus assembly ATPase PilB-like protein
MGDTILGVVAQRLLKKLCDHCKKVAPPTVPDEKLAEIARIYYVSGTKKSTAEEKRGAGPEPVSEILPRVMLKIASLYKQRAN